LTGWRRVDDLPKDPEEARMWLFTVARNVLLNHQRGERRRWALTERIRSVLDHSPSVSPAADEGVEVREAIAHLDAERRELIRLVHWEGLTIAAAASILDIPASTARNRYQEAKTVLRQALSDPAGSGAIAHQRE